MKSMRLLYKRFRLFLTLLYCKTFRKNVPVVLYLLLTDRCQMRCRYCFVDHVNTRKEMTTEEVFGIVGSSMIEDIMQGYNGTIFAYGQTGSGKTYTMSGGGPIWESRGIIPRVFT